MSKIVPAGYLPVDGIEFRTRRPIRATDWNAIAESQNYLYSRRGERLGGLVFENAWENNTSTYTVETTSLLTGKDLDEWVPIFTSRKRINELGGASSFSLQIYGRDYDARIRIIDAEDGVTTYDTFTLVNPSSTKQWSQLNFALDDVVICRPNGTPRPLTITLEARRVLTKAEIYQVHLRSKVLVASELPNREYVWDRCPILHTFTPAGATGYLGPSQAQVDAAYDNTNLEGLVTVVGVGFQDWIVPFTGIWEITAYGAGFNGVSNQKGAKAQGRYLLETGEKLRMIVGHVGNNIRCGSGGSFVGIYDRAVSTGDIVVADGFRFLPLVIAGGAGGTLTANVVGIGGQSGTQGANSSTGALGGTGPAGGAGAGFAVGGAGWTGNGGGGDGTAPYNTTRSFINGGWGNLAGDTTPGSFGGGGTGRLATNYRFGGGGGYGGGAAAQTSLSTGWAGGGGSYTDPSGSGLSTTAAFNAGNGYITVEYVGQ